MGDDYKENSGTTTQADYENLRKPNNIFGWKDDGHTIFSGEKAVEAARNSPLEPAVDFGEGVKKFKDGEPGAEWSIGRSIWGALGGGVKGAAAGAVGGGLGTAGIDYAKQKHQESQQNKDNQKSDDSNTLNMTTSELNGNNLPLSGEKDKQKSDDDGKADEDGRDSNWGKGVLDKLLKLTDWLNGGFDWIGDKVSFSKWYKINRSGKFHIFYDPLVLDLDGDGVELISENNWNGVLFDFNGNGIKTATQWVSSDDGLLVWDRNKNGKIDNGSELFGEDTIKISANDEFFTKHFVYNFQVA